MRFLVFSAAAVIAGASPEEVDSSPWSKSLYCRLLNIGLKDAALQPLVGDEAIRLVANIPLLGDIDVATTRVEVGAVQTGRCAASADDQGAFNVGISGLGVEVRRMDWQYLQRSWPHVQDIGRAAATANASLTVSFDMNREDFNVSAIDLSQSDLHLNARRHPWVTPALEKWTSMSQPLVGWGAVQLLAEKAVDNSLKTVQKKGACAFVEHWLESLDMKDFRFASHEPVSTHVPSIGNVSITVNSTSIVSPSTMQCWHKGFNGTTLMAYVDGVSFSAGFKWAYQKNGSSSWHNKTAHTDVTSGFMLHIDMLEMKETRIYPDGPNLKLHLHSGANKWMYEALDAVMVPVVHGSLWKYAYGVLIKDVSECFKDPDCGHIAPPSAPRFDPLRPSAATVDPASIVVV